MLLRKSMAIALAEDLNPNPKQKNMNPPLPTDTSCR